MSDLPLLKRKHKVIIAVLLMALFFLLLIIKAPAKLVFSAAKLAGVPLYAVGVGGTLWRGHADQLALPIEGGEYWQLGEVDWQLEALPLLLGRIDIAAQSHYKAQKLNVVAQLSSASLVLKRADIQLPAPLLGRLFPMLPLLGGALEAKVDHAEVDLSTNNLLSLEAQLWWRGLSVDQGSYVLLGDYHADVHNLNEGIKADIKDLQANLAVSGTVSLAQSGSYQVNLNLRPTNRLDPSAIEVLSLLAPQQRDGSYLIKQGGRL
ncbi:type II secretion system (T2SS) protein N [Sinobacterium caligoides]|uniref:Type II secretion system protein N n=1 Tax=Sinobacterium caligoides TaxID=933926 RepID=A0A3N2E0N9_9GAMM|nr:type II secretion system protein N [Sinobacterium caligoides]ROS05199.1 type II secretion system (T2SS) protein N [Sinobacterium caligoides]